MDFLQILLVAVVVVLTALLVFIGVQVILILRDARRTLRRMEGMVADGQRWFTAVGQPLTNFSNVVAAASSFGKWFKNVVEEWRVGKGVDQGGEGVGEERWKEGSGEQAVPERTLAMRRRGGEPSGKFFHKEGRSLVN